MSNIKLTKFVYRRSYDRPTEYLAWCGFNEVPKTNDDAYDEIKEYFNQWGYEYNVDYMLPDWNFGRIPSRVFIILFDNAESFEMLRTIFKLDGYNV